jgi:hypothetical protein
MKIKTKDLTGAALNEAVFIAAKTTHTDLAFKIGALSGDELEEEAMAWNVDITIVGGDEELRSEILEQAALRKPSTRWEDGGPIIEREEISVGPIDVSGPWLAMPVRGKNKDAIFGPTPLIAAMRCYVASKLGDEVEVPDELG